MSIASQFREKWRVIAEAAWETRGEEEDARYAMMSRMVDEAGYAVVPKSMIAAYQKRIDELTALRAPSSRAGTSEG